MLERTLSENLAALGRVGARGLDAILADVSADGVVETSADVVVGVVCKEREVTFDECSRSFVAFQ